MQRKRPSKSRGKRSVTKRSKIKASSSGSRQKGRSGRRQGAQGRASRESAVERAARVIRRAGGTVKGPLRTSRSRYVTPTKRGFRSVKPTVSRGLEGRTPALKTIKVTVRLRDPKTGKFKQAGKTRVISAPRLKDVARKYRGKNARRALRTEMNKRIRETVFAVAHDEFEGTDIEDRYDALFEGVRSGKMSSKRARKELEKLKKLRHVKFKVEVQSHGA